MMMQTKRAFVIVAALTLGACAEHPQLSDHAIQQECRLELAAARTAIHMRDEGKTRQAMLASLPPLTPNSSRLLQQLYHIVDEVYAYASLNEVVYGSYRYDYCVRQLQHQPVPAQFQDSVPRLQACQAQFGLQISQTALACVRESFPTAADLHTP